MPHRLYIFKKIFLLKSPAFLGIFGGVTWITFKYFPAERFIWILSTAMVVDLLTGILRAWKDGNYTTVKGLRKTIDKATQYIGFIVVAILLMNMTLAEKDLSRYAIVIDASLSFMVLIELFSICENLVAISPESKIVQYVIAPFIRMLHGRLPGSGKKDKPNTH